MERETFFLGTGPSRIFLFWCIGLPIEDQLKNFNWYSIPTEKNNNSVYTLLHHGSWQLGKISIGL